MGAKVSELLCGGEHEECCELSNVISCVIALVLSVCAACMNLSSKGDVEDCLLGLGGGASSLSGMMDMFAITYAVIVILNTVSSAAIWLSFFHCEKFENAFKHQLTSSRTLCWLRILCSGTFVLQIFRSGYALAFHGAVAFLAYLCNQGPGVVYLAQELIYAIGNSSSPEGQLFVPNATTYGSHKASTPYLDVGSAVTGMDLSTYCKDSGSEDSAANLVVVACFLTIVSQALMVCALNGEKERVSVHEQHEHHLMHSAEHAGAEAGASAGSTMGRDIGHALGGNAGAAVGASFGAAVGRREGEFVGHGAGVVGEAVEHMPLLAKQGVASAEKSANSMLGPQGQQSLHEFTRSMGVAGHKVELMGQDAMKSASGYLGPAGQTALHDLTKRFGGASGAAPSAPGASAAKPPASGASTSATAPASAGKSAAPGASAGR